MRSVFNFTLLFVVLVLGATFVQAQQRPGSPRGEAATQIGGEYVERRYTGGKWVTVDYGRPILRGRTGLFGTGDNYGKTLYRGAPVWRAGANKSTRFKTEADLMFGDKKLAAGEYSLFIELKSTGWTLILSNHTAKDSFRAPGDGLWGAYNYTADKDVVRVPMTLGQLNVSVDQLTYSFVNGSKTGGTLSLIWDKNMASVDFALAK